MFKYVLFTLLLVIGAGCSNKKSAVEDSRLRVVTSNFALYDFVRVVGGDLVDASLLLPPGVEAHSFEPSPRDIVTVKKSDLFVCIDPEVEPWVQTIAAGINLDRNQLLKSGNGVTFLSHGKDDHSSCSSEGHNHSAEKSGKDPHIWLDPIRAQKIVSNIVAAMAESDTNSADLYIQRGDSLIAELKALDARFQKTFSEVTSTTIMYAGHFAFGYFTERYGLTHISPYHGFSPNAEPSPAKIASLIEAVKEKNISAIYYEELVEPRIARIITEETGVDMILLHGIHNVSSRELVGSFSYLSGMEQNRINLERGLSK